VLTQTQGCQPIIVNPNGNLTVNYLDTGETPLSPLHLAFSAGLCMLFCGDEGMDGERKAIRHAMIVENLQQLGWLPVLDGPMWHSGRLLSESSAFGDVLHSFFGYSDAPTPLQLLIYVGYLAIVVLAYLGVRARLVARAHRPHGVTH